MAYCIQCGHELEEGSLFCASCGTRVASSVQSSAVPAARDATVPMAAGVGSAPPRTYAQQVQQTHSDTASLPPSGYYGQPGGAAPQYNGSPNGGGTGKKSIVPLIITLGAVLIIAALIAGFVLVRGGAEAQELEVTFDTNGGSAVPAQHVQKGASVSYPIVPTKDGYEFAGWYEDKACTQEAHFPQAIDSETTFYAKWEESASAGGSADEPKPSAQSTSSANASSDSAPTGLPSAGGVLPKPNSSGSESATYDVVTIRFEFNDGTGSDQDIRRVGTTERVIPDSNTRKLEASDIKDLSDAELCIAYNEIIASSNGYLFKNTGLNTYFTSYCHSWYRANASAEAGGNLQSPAAENVEFLKAHTDPRYFDLKVY